MLSIDQLLEAADAQQFMEAVLSHIPTLRWKPSAGQELFLRAPHPVRLMVPGNGFGKTVIMGREANHWAWGNHPYQKTPDPKRTRIFWFCEQYKQFDELRTLLESKCLTKPYTWNEQKHCYIFGSGARMTIYSYDRPWTDIQGVPCDLMCFDEQPPIRLWREATQRRRADRKTRFVIAATATEGESWMEKDLWTPWVDAHKEKGIGIDKAVEAQVHPDYWVLDRGGIHDNPGADAEDHRWYETRPWSSDEERRVRLYGGFGRFNGRPVFSLEALGKMLDEAAQLDKAQGAGKIGGVRVLEKAA